jgi:ABC-type sulfate/molybdate transport systems ATPase subunit
VEKGQVLGLCGPSGSGKSMLMKILCGIEKADTGTISLGNTVWYDSKNRIFLPVHKRHAGYLFQSYALFPHKSALENIKAGMIGKHHLHALSKEERAKKAEELLKRVGLENCALIKPDKLSGGQKQRLAMARMLADSPEVWMLDEPFSALDTKTKEEMKAFLKEQMQNADVPVIFCSHDPKEVQELCDLWIELEEGKVIRTVQNNK